MQGHHHPIGEEFPEFKLKIHYLKQSDAHFRTLCDRYEEIDKAIARAESRIEIVTEIEEEKMRKERLVLKDQLLAMLNSHK